MQRLSLPLGPRGQLGGMPGAGVQDKVPPQVSPSPYNPVPGQDRRGGGERSHPLTDSPPPALRQLSDLGQELVLSGSFCKMADAQHCPGAQVVPQPEPCPRQPLRGGWVVFAATLLLEAHSPRTSPCMPPPKSLFLGGFRNLGELP